MPSQRIPNQEIEKYAKNALKRLTKRLFEVKELKNKLPCYSFDAAPFSPASAHLRPSRKSEDHTVVRANIVVDLTVCTSLKMAKINLEHRGKNKPTDVLSFPASEFFWNQGMLGDLVLCGQVITKQAAEQNHSWKKEVDVLLVHGLLHLLGFDHEQGPKHAREMAALEEKVLNVKSVSVVKAGKKVSPGLIKRVAQW